MSISATQVILHGNLTADPVLRATEAGTPVTNFRVACTDRVYDRESGAWTGGETVYISVTCWRAVGNVVASLAKGVHVTVVGRLQQRSFEVDGAERTVIEVEADDVAVNLRFAVAAPTRSIGGAVQTQ